MDKDRCNGCKAIIQVKSYMSCPGCNEKYDLQCANMSPQCYKAMNVEKKRKWRCDECKSKQPKCGNSGTPVRPNSEKSPVDSAVVPEHSESSKVTTRKKLELSYITEDRLLEIMKSERQAMKATIESSAKGLSEQLKYINEQCTGSKESISFVSQQYEDLKMEISDLKKLLGVNVAEVKQLREENKSLKADMNGYVARIRAGTEKPGFVIK